jgi:hypothetical protein
MLIDIWHLMLHTFDGLDHLGSLDLTVRNLAHTISRLDVVSGSVLNMKANTMSSQARVDNYFRAYSTFRTYCAARTRLWAGDRVFIGVKISTHTRDRSKFWHGANSDPGIIGLCSVLQGCHQS